MQLEGTRQSVVESIRFSKNWMWCPHGGAHYTLKIEWTDPSGFPDQGPAREWCTHPLCPASDVPWGALLSSAPPLLLSTAWVPRPKAWEDLPVATAYFLAVEDPEGLRFPKIVARVGICDQWDDIYEGGPAGTALYVHRFHGESGPGVYPAQIGVTECPNSEQPNQ